MRLEKDRSQPCERERSLVIKERKTTIKNDIHGAPTKRQTTEEFRSTPNKVAEIERPRERFINFIAQHPL